MTKDIDKSIGDQPTLLGGKPVEPMERSLGDRSTFIGDSPSSVADLSDLGTDVDQGMEIVDLAARYTIEKTLGKGGMGEVLLATDTRLDRKVAIKRILGEAARSKSAVNRFLTEAKAIAALSHPNIVHINDYGRDKDGPFLIMEYVDGGSLLDRCREGAIPLEQIVDLTRQLCDGLSRAHDAGIIHRDIKPANILLTRDGIPKLTDFGLAKAASSDTGMTMAGAVLGTLDFMPPEQRKDTSLTDSRSDLWSLAATLYQMVTGEPPRVIDLEAVPKQLRATISKALKSKKEERFQTARELKDFLLTSQRASASVDLDLAEGDCPKCGTKNPTNRKFCRNPDCGVSLEVPCLSCQTKMPLWEHVCDNCGARQRDLLQQRREKMASEQSEAENHLRGNEFDRAKKLAIALRDEPDVRLGHLQEWANGFLLKVEKAREQELSKVSELIAESLRHEAAYDYGAAIKALNQVPKPLRETPIPNQTDRVCKLLRRLESKQAECLKLDKSIRESLATKQFSSLSEQVDRLLELRPDRQDVQKIRGQLIERDTNLAKAAREAYELAQEAMRSCDYDIVFERLKQVDPDFMDSSMRELALEARTKRDRRNELRSFIQESIKSERYGGLPEQVDELLLLDPNNSQMIQLRAQLADRRKKIELQRSQVLEQVGSLLQSGGFQQAIDNLRTIPEEFRDEDVEARLSQMMDLSRSQSEVLAELKSGLEYSNYDTAQGLAKNYQMLLGSHHANDPDFEQLYVRFLTEQKEVARAEKRFIMVGVSSFAIVVLVMGGLLYWLQVSRKAAEKAKAEEAILAERPILNSINLALRKLPGGTFTMVEDSEAHQVTFTYPFYIGVYEVTQAQYARVMGDNPSYFKGASNPVENVSWNDAVEFCRRLSDLPEEKAAGREYRLPTEAEWDYACRAGTRNLYSFGDDEKGLEKYAWYDKNSISTTHPVGQKQPNAWGLYDMHGNVWEWCSDWYGVYPKGAVSDPVGPSSGSSRVFRGGGWGSEAAFCRSAHRSGSSPVIRRNYYGFRVALSSPEIPE